MEVYLYVLQNYSFKAYFGNNQKLFLNDQDLCRLTLEFDSFYFDIDWKVRGDNSDFVYPNYWRDRVIPILIRKKWLILYKPLLNLILKFQCNTWEKK
jgi:hypothetical protein